MKHIKLQHMEEKDTDSQTRKKQNFLTQTRKTENEMGREREREREREKEIITTLYYISHDQIDGYYIIHI